MKKVYVGSLGTSIIFHFHVDLTFWVYSDIVYFISHVSFDLFFQSVIHSEFLVSWIVSTIGISFLHRNRIVLDRTSLVFGRSGFYMGYFFLFLQGCVYGSHFCIELVSFLTELRWYLNSRYKNPGLEVYCFNFLLTSPLWIIKVKNRFAQFLITLPSSPLWIGSLFNHMIKEWAKQTNLYTQVQVVNKRKKQKTSRPGFFIRTMVFGNSWVLYGMFLYVFTRLCL